MEEFLTKWQPLFSLVSAVLGGGTVVILIALWGVLEKTFSHRIDAIKDQKGVTEDRLKLSIEERESSERRCGELEKALKKLQNTILEQSAIAIAPRHHQDKKKKSFHREQK